MGFVRSALVAVCLSSASVASAQSNGVPFIDGNWQGKIKAIFYDQTVEGSNDPKFRYRDRVEAVIDQDDGDLDFEIFFEDGFPSSSSSTILSLDLDGFVGNSHMSIVQTEEAGVLLVGSGRIQKNARKIKIKGTAASEDYTIEFEINLKRQNR